MTYAALVITALRAASPRSPALLGTSSPAPEPRTSLTVRNAPQDPTVMALAWLLQMGCATKAITALLLKLCGTPTTTRALMVISVLWEARLLRYVPPGPTRMKCTLMTARSVQRGSIAIMP